MPNWCMNDITIKGPKDFLDELAQSELSLAKLVPWPKDLENMDKVTPVPKNEVQLRRQLKKKYGVDSLFDWCVTKWGTKWDIDLKSNIEVEEVYGNKKNKQYYLGTQFDTAWSPPVEAFKAIYEQHKDKGIEIFLYYYEPGCGYCGSLVIKGGKTYDEYYEYKTADELEKILEKHENPLLDDEVANMRDLEEHFGEVKARSKEPKPDYPKGKVPAKPASKSPAAAKPAKKAASKPAAKPAKKAAAKVAKKAAKPAKKIPIKSKK